MQNAPLFQRYPLVSQFRLSSGELVPVPYHIYRGTIALIGGTAPLERVQQWLQGQELYPLTTRNGRAALAVWICDFQEASLGAHHELQFSVFASREPVPPIGDSPLAVLDFLYFNPHARLFCAAIWNNTQRVVQYNNELLHLGARLTHSRIESSSTQTTFDFQDDGQPLCSGQFAIVPRQPLNAIRELWRVLGWRKFLQLGALETMSMQVVNRIQPDLPYHTEAQAYTISRERVTRFWQPDTDQLRWHSEQYQTLNFTPHYLTRLTDTQFVYLNIHNRGNERYPNR